MKRILAKAHVPVLEQFAWSNVLLAFDFDGTLAPIVSNPAAAKLRRGTRALLLRVAQLYPCAVISGRSRADAEKRVEGLGLVSVIGNHGSEPSPGAIEYEAQVHAWARALREELTGITGVKVEEKGASIAVHYRSARSRRDAKRRIDDAIAKRVTSARLIGGKLVVNVVPEGAPHKGIALQSLRAQVSADTAVYVGDDVTDEDVFALDEPGRLLSIRVGRSRASAAAYYLEAQEDIDTLLGLLVKFRPADRAVLGALGRRYGA